MQITVQRSDSRIVRICSPSVKVIQTRCVDDTVFCEYLEKWEFAKSGLDQ
jgi:hypothetical protein